MKKVLVFAMAALMLMACENNGGGGGTSKDKKAYTATTTDATALIGKDIKAVDKHFLDAGYTKVGTEVKMPARINKPAIKLAEGNYEEFYYVYNVPENFPRMSKEEADKYVVDLIKKGDGYIQVFVTMKDGKCYFIGHTGIYALTTDLTGMYIDASDKLNEQISEVKDALQKVWQGAMSEGEHADDVDYTDRVKYITDVKAKAATGVYAYEIAMAITSENYDGQMYNLTFYTPTEAEKADLEKEAGVAYSYVAGVISTPAYVINANR